MTVSRAARRALLTAAGATLVVAGLALLVLPGPGLLLVLVGLVLLTKEYRWAQRLYTPVRDRALAAADASVATPPRLTCSVLAALVPIAAGVALIVVPRLPLSGVGTGSSLILAGLLALALLLYSRRRRFRSGFVSDGS
jgi:hypothetical protein